MVSRGYETPVAARSNWVTVEPNWFIGLGWVAGLAGAILLTVQTAIYIGQNGLFADRPSLATSQVVLRIALVLGAIVLWFVRRNLIERAALTVGVVAAGSSTLFGLGMRSPLLASIRLLSHLALYALAATVAWRVLIATQREMSHPR